MPAYEVTLSLVATYGASEYLYGSQRRAGYAVVGALAANLLLLAPALSPLLGLKAKVPLVATIYVASLYVDTVACRGQFGGGAEFLSALMDAAVRLLPLFPLLSVMFAFVFLELGELCEHMLGMSDASISAWLNQPIYYGVLYGPFAYIYVRVKAVARRAHTLLPTTAARSL